MKRTRTDTATTSGRRENAARAVVLGLLATSPLAGCAPPEPIEQTVAFHVPEAPQILASDPSRTKTFRERLYDGLRSGDTSETTYAPPAPDTKAQ